MTRNMHRHVKTCSGNEAAKAADDAKSVKQVHKYIIEGILYNGSITTTFEQKGQEGYLQPLAAYLVLK